MCMALWFNEDFIEEIQMCGDGSLYTDDKGVFQMAWIEQDKRSLPNWDDRAPWGPGGPPQES